MVGSGVRIGNGHRSRVHLEGDAAGDIDEIAELVSRRRGYPMGGLMSSVRSRVRDCGGVGDSRRHRKVTPAVSARARIEEAASS
jgi:hypothetical protein